MSPMNKKLYIRSKVNIVNDGSAHMERIGALHKDKESRSVEDAFYITNLSVVMSQWRKWQNCMPTIQPHYAIKANPDNVIITTLGMLGAGFDCASKGEIEKVLSCGFPPERIIYANTVKAPSHIRYAAENGVEMMTFDNPVELDKIKANAPNSKLVLRIFAMDQSAISKLSLKFGCDSQTKAPALMKRAKELGLNIIGISFHVGGGSKNPTAYAEAIANARRLFRVGKELGFDDMHLLDIGGGYPGFCSEVVSLLKIAQVVNEAIEEHFGDVKRLRVISEPGRFFAMPSATLVASVVGKSSVPTQLLTGNPYHDTTANMYYINDGVFGSFNCVPVYKIEPPAIAFGKDYSTLTWARVWGPTCDSADILAPTVMLPELDIGDWLVYEYMGAYTNCIASQFNGFQPALSEYIINETDSKEIRELQKKIDLYNNLHKTVSVTISGGSGGDSGANSDSGMNSDDIESICSAG